VQRGTALVAEERLPVGDLHPAAGTEVGPLFRQVGGQAASAFLAEDRIIVRIFGSALGAELDHRERSLKIT
jgi:hypothetical protein